MHKAHGGLARGLLSLACAVALCGLLPQAAWAQATAPAEVANDQSFDIAAGTLADALTEFGLQSGLQISYPPEAVQGRRSGAIRGRYRPADALRLLLRGTGMEFSFINGSTVLVRPAAPAEPPATPTRRPDPPRPPAVAETESPVVMPEIMVQGTRTLNMDIARSRDDAQPYVVFDRETIEQSGARSLEDFLRQRLPQNSQGQANEQSASFFGNLPQINLRGLGTGQTLLLVDGRRLSPTGTTSVVGPPYQPDINGIPLASIERIEVLPTTASGIYGGSATGGVVNIVTRRDYVGIEAKLSYGNTFDTDVARHRVDVNGGFNFGEGRTTISLSGSFSDANALMSRDRDFYVRGVDRILQNNPGQYYNAIWAGATANIRSATGVPLTLRGSNVSLGSPITFVPAGYRGFGTDGGAAFMANAGRFNLDPHNTAGLVGGGGVNLLSEPTVTSLRGTLRHAFTDTWEAFLDVGASENDVRGMTNRAPAAFVVPATAPTNPFNQAVQVALYTSATDGILESVSETKRAAGGFIFKLPRDWMGTAEYTWSEARFEFAAPGLYSPALNTAIALGQVDLFRDPVDLSAYVLDRSQGQHTIEPFVTTQTALSGRMSGPVFQLPGGAATLTGLIERREDTFREASLLTAPGVTTVYPSRSQSVDSLYLEAAFPFVGAANARPGLRLFDIRLSGRHDRYQQHGSTGVVSSPTTPIIRVRTELDSTNPTIGLRWSPLEALVLRASYGTGFMPPPVTQLTPNAPVLQPYADPRRGNQSTLFEVISGGNPTLQPEESKSWSAGAIFKPGFLPGLRLSVDYINIDKVDGIATLPIAQILQFEEFLPGRVVRAAPTPGDQYGVGQIVRVDGTAMNLSTAEIEAVDVGLDYERPLGDDGTLVLFAIASRQFHYLTRVTEISPVIENVGNGFGNPQKLKGNFGVMWRDASWNIGWYGRYYAGYRVPAASALAQGNGGMVSSQVFHDLNVTWRPALDGSGRGLQRLFADVEYQIGIVNVFDKRPAFDSSNTTSYYSLLGDPRLRSYQLSLKVNF